ncbi:MAG: ABC transporter substrate-binding protein [Bauldia sp.]|nr:ABC transporter substrate-binding protein [Bauldia sp.]
MSVLKNRLLMASALVAVAVVGPAFAQGQNVTIGFLGGFTGPIEAMTPSVLAGAELAVSQVNAQGGILGGGTLNIVSADGGCDATTAASAGDRLVNSEQVVAIVGGMCTGETIAAANGSAIAGNVVMVSPASTAPTLTTLDDNDLVFRVLPSDAYQGDVLARLVLSKGIEEVALTWVNNDYGNGFADAFRHAFEEAGGIVSAAASHEEGRADYRPEIGTLAASGAQALVILAYGNGSGQTVLRQAVESGNFATYIAGDGMVLDSLFSGINAAAVEGMIATKPADPDVPGAPIFAEAASAAGIDPTAIFASQAYDAAFLLALAIEKNGSADRAGLSAALREVATAPGEIILPGEWEKAVELIAAGVDINYEGASGLQEFDEVGDVPGAFLEMTVVSGTFTEVGLAE